MLEKVTKGKIKRPLSMCLYGTEGVGKTTFASKTDSPIFAGPESGNDNLDVSRFPTPKSWTDLLAQIEALYNEKHNYKTLIIDSLDWCESLLHAELTALHKVKTIEDVAGGYGRYVAVVNTEWKKLIDLTKKLRDEKGIGIIFIAHYMVKTFNDPMTNNPYDRYQMKLLEKSSALFREYVDIMGFATFEVATRGDPGKKGKGLGDGVRVMYTEKRPAHDAKNRFSLPYRMEFSFEALEAAMGMATEDKIKNMKADIADILTDMTDTVLIGKVKDAVEKAMDDYVALAAIKNRLIILNQQ